MIKTSKTKKGITSIFFLIVIGFAGWSFYNYLEAKKELVKLSSAEGQEEAQKQEVNALLDQVNKHMILPDDEQPTVATVTNVDELKGQQPFFERASNGDKIIIYANSQRAIIYSPEKDIIVNVGTLLADNPNIEKPEEDQTEQQEESGKLDIEIRNGTGKEGLARGMSSQLKEKNHNFNFVAINEAFRKDYSETTIVDMGGNNNKDEDLVRALVQELGAALTTELPDGEKDSDAQILIIIGEDQAGSE